VDGSANVIFYDRRQDPQNRTQVVVLARSTDAGRTFKNYAWTSEPFEASGIFFGDYTGLAAAGGRVYGVWMEKPAAEKDAEGSKKGGEVKPNEVKPTDGKSDEAKAKETKPKPRGTVVKVGVADFNSGVGVAGSGK
jgi:hypothetical protein